ncbi:MAG: 4Fe-4S dicluster domain-containing protein [Desulforudis sp.]|jgi:quinone-modifying oxidoreductase subunit QmoC|nr:4Fe-4S dicluster domain-containing protein [Clostridia bacterium]MDQ7791622.1 4Fe-4S dicluster domain-containing protein [Clostridia bacterium]RJX21389.1 MAG: 4Fe-4S dicluster domain-containing protein [Desulforudis sp.]
MSADKEQATPKYEPAFHREFRAIENGAYASQCMQCGLCAVTCPARELMDYTPRRLFKMIHAGEKEKVMNANTPWLCTSCYLCTVRCPRGIPIVDVMHGLKHELAKKSCKSGVALLSKVFFQSAMKRGRVYEAAMTNSFYMKLGPGSIPDAMKQQDVGLDMIKHKRLPLFPPKKIKGLKDLKKIYEKAAAIQKEAHKDGV